jgi:hypothetical protein
VIGKLEEHQNPRNQEARKNDRVSRLQITGDHQITRDHGDLLPIRSLH